jgi:hypothetical protein
MHCCQEFSTVRLVDYLGSPGHRAQLLALQGSCLDAAPQESKGPHQRQHLYNGAFACTQTPHAVSVTAARCTPTRSPFPNNSCAYGNSSSHCACFSQPLLEGTLGTQDVESMVCDTPVLSTDNVGEVVNFTREEIGMFEEGVDILS